MSAPAASSPKRRVLAPVDVNRTSSAPARPPMGKFATAAPSVPPLKLSASSRPSLPAEQDQPRKRPFASMAGDAAAAHHRQPQPAKKACMDPEVHDREPPFSSDATQPQEEQMESIDDETDPRTRSPSPADSMFDTSIIDTTQATALTEPETVGSAATASQAAPEAAVSLPPRRPHSGSESTRQKAEIIRLRLSLAAYKVRTGQTDVPLDRLQMIRPASSGGFSSPRPSSAAGAAQPKPTHRASFASTLSSESRRSSAPTFPAVARIHPPPVVLSAPSEAVPVTRRESADDKETHRYHRAQESRQEQQQQQQQDEEQQTHSSPRGANLPAPQLPRISSLAAPAPIMIPSGPRNEAAEGLIRSPLRGPAADGLLELMKSSQ